MIKRGKAKPQGTIAFKGSVSFSTRPIEPMTKEEAELLVKQLYSWRREKEHASKAKHDEGA